MMYSYGSVGAVFPALHVLGAVFFVCGVVLLLAWAIRHMSGERQKYWGGMLILAAAVLWLIGIAASMAAGGIGRGGLLRPAMIEAKHPAMKGTKGYNASTRSAKTSSSRSSVKPSTKSTTTGERNTQPKSEGTGTKE
jgi:hypothetical protein